MLAGDHLQLPPVNGTALYKVPAVLNDAPDSFYLRMTSKQLIVPEHVDRGQVAYWRTKRAASDTLCDLINSRTTAQLQQQVDEDGNNVLKEILKKPGLTVIAPDNHTRHAFNLLYTRLAAAHPNRIVFQIKGNITRPRDRRRTRERVAICDKDVFRLVREPETTTELPAILELCVGMEMRVKTNQCVAKGCANGAVGVVHHIGWKPETTFTRTASNMYRPSCAPLNVWIDLPNAPRGPRFPGMPAAWPDTVIPLAVEKKDFLYIAGGSTSRERVVSTTGDSLPLCVNNTKTNRSKYPNHVVAHIEQYPMVPAFAMTVHGVQGVTKNAIALADPRSAGMERLISGASLYVALSRLRRSKYLWVLQPIPRAVLKSMKPDPLVLAEDKRLQMLDELTKTAFNQGTAIAPGDPRIAKLFDDAILFSRQHAAEKQVAKRASDALNARFRRLANKRAGGEDGSQNAKKQKTQ
ncbi:hypothetical protein H9P43_003658 [Blastocladiella emersonii ATCC 22665]|nr:hypothetical protein H9P43_003658 [Blastocladiella emersonii ATCC 22665]